MEAGHACRQWGLAALMEPEVQGSRHAGLQDAVAGSVVPSMPLQVRRVAFLVLADSRKITFDRLR